MAIYTNAWFHSVWGQLSGEHGGFASPSRRAKIINLLFVPKDVHSYKLSVMYGAPAKDTELDQVGSAGYVLHLSFGGMYAEAHCEE